jgi:hypothetical protein
LFTSENILLSNKAFVGGVVVQQNKLDFVLKFFFSLFDPKNNNNKPFLYFFLITVHLFASINNSLQKYVKKVFFLQNATHFQTLIAEKIF